MYSAFGGGKRKKEDRMVRNKTKRKQEEIWKKKIKKFSEIYYIFTLLISSLNPNFFLEMKREGPGEMSCS